LVGILFVGSLVERYKPGAQKARLIIRCSRIFVEGKSGEEGESGGTESD
jgi:hypothetical protein